jgi:hypothetical protein
MALSLVLARQIFGLMSLRLTGLHRRSMQYLIYGAFIPWLFMTIVSSVTPAADSLRLIAGAGIVSCCFLQLRAPAALFASERLSGVQGLLKNVAAIDATAYLTAFVCGSIALLTISLGLLIVMAAVRDVGVPGSSAWIIPIFLLSITLHGLSLVIARSQLGLATVMLIVDLIVTAIIVFCPIFYRHEAVPAAIWPLVRFAPPTLAADAVMQFWRGSADGWWPTMQLAGWAIVCLFIGYRRIRIG